MCSTNLALQPMDQAERLAFIEEWHRELFDFGIMDRHAREEETRLAKAALDAEAQAWIDSIPP